MAAAAAATATTPTMTSEVHPNFPSGLNIRPLVSSLDENVFDEANQEDAIEQYGIAGRVW